MRALVNDVELFDANLVDLVENVDARHINAVAFDDVNQLVNSRVLSEVEVSVRNFELGGDGLHSLFAHVSHVKVHGLDDVDSALILALDDNVWRLLVEPQAKAFQLVLDLATVCQRLDDIKHDQNASARAGDTDDLSTATLAVLGPLNNSRQIEQLDVGALVVVDTRDASERCELVVSGFGVGAGELAEKSGLSDGREADEADTRITSCLDVETVLTATTLFGAFYEITLELGQLGSEQTQMTFGGFVFLRTRHFCLDVRNFLLNRH